MSDTTVASQKMWRRLGWAIAAAIFVSDQITKWLILDLFSDSERPYFVITSFFNIVLAWNRGISFGMFGDGGALAGNLLIGITLMIAVGLSVWLTSVQTRQSAVALGLIIGGAVGNVIDRFRFGAVTDFLDLHVLGYHWPAFNIADSAIVIGAIVLMWESLFDNEKPLTKKDGKVDNGGKTPGA